jgi:hypothetical protein
VIPAQQRERERERESTETDMIPPGFRFYPTEEELVSFYLHNKLEARREDLLRVMDRLIPVLDIYEFNPWELPRKNLLFVELII